MVTHLPHGLQKLLEVTVGMPWPEGDEDDLWDLSAVWESFAQDLDELASGLISAANNFSQAIQGTTGDSLHKALATDLHDGAAQLKEQAEAYSKMLKNAAADIQKTKIMIIVMLGILAATIAALLSSLFGSFAVPSVIAAARVGIGAALRSLVARLMEIGLVNIARRLAIRTIAGAAFGAAFMVGLDSGIQGVQIAQGHRQGFDTNALKGDAIGGAIGGALGGFAEGFTSIAAKIGRDLWRILPRGVRGFGPLGNALLQIPAAALSNPVVNAATNSPGGAIDGIFGALEPGGGRSHTHVPDAPNIDVRPLAGLNLSPPLEMSRGEQAIPVPVTHSDGRSIGVGFISGETIEPTAERANEGLSARTDGQNTAGPVSSGGTPTRTTDATPARTANPATPAETRTEGDTRRHPTSERSTKDASGSGPAEMSTTSSGPTHATDAHRTTSDNGLPTATPPTEVSRQTAQSADDKSVPEPRLSQDDLSGGSSDVAPHGGRPIEAVSTEDSLRIGGSGSSEAGRGAEARGVSETGDATVESRVPVDGTQPGTPPAQADKATGERGEPRASETAGRTGGPREAAPVPSHGDSAGQVPLPPIPEETFRDTPLQGTTAGFDALLRDLNVRVFEEPGTRPGETTYSFELLGPPAAQRRYNVSPLEGPLAERLPGGFTLSDAAAGSRFHFAADGTLNAAEVRLERDLGTLHRDFSASRQALSLLDSEGRPLERFSAGMSPDGRVTVVSAPTDGLAPERLVVDPVSGRIVENTAFGQHILFKGGSSRLSADELRAIDELAARTAREGLAAFDGNRPLPKVTIEGYGNGTLLGQPVESRAIRNGLDRSKAVEKAFNHSLGKYVEAAAAERTVTPNVSDFSVEAGSQGRNYPAGVRPEDGPAARRRAVITVASPARESAHDHGGNESEHSEGVVHGPVESTAEQTTALEETPLQEPSAPAAKRSGSSLQELITHDTTAESFHAELPWYVDQDGMDSLGEVAIREVHRWDEDLIRMWADEITSEVRRDGDSLKLETGIRSALHALLTGPTSDLASSERAAHTLEAEQNRELEFWETVLQRGQLSMADGHVLWLRPVLQKVRPLPPQEASAVQRSNVNWGTMTTTEKSEWEKGLSVESMFLGTLSTGLKVVSSVTSGPFLEVSARRTGKTNKQNYVIFDRKVWMTQGRPFRGGLHVRVFLDGEERLHSAVTPPRLTVELPKALTAPGGLRHVTHAEPTHAEPTGADLVEGGAELPVAGPHRAREVINAIDLIPVAAEFQRRLHDAGLPPEGVRELMHQTLALLNERAAMNRSRYLFDNEVVTDRVSFSTGLGSSFKGQVTFRAVVEGLEYLGDSSKVPVREDSGGSLKVQRGWGGKSTVDVGARVVTAPLEFVSVKGGLSRSAGHGLTEETGIHTVLQTTDDQSRYRAWLRVVVESQSTTHRIEPVTRIVPAEIGVPRHEAADFERRLLGGDARRLRERVPGPDGTEVAPPYVRSPLADGPEPGLGLPESAYRRPARLDAPLPQPHPREPLALASRRGLGFGTSIGLPGSSLVHEQLRTVLLQKHQEWTGQRRVDLSGVNRPLLGGFGRPALEGDLPRLLSGIEHSVKLGGKTYHLSVSARLLERVDGLTGEDARALSINLRASQVAVVSGHRDHSWHVDGFLGVRARFGLEPWFKLQLGQIGLTGGFGGGDKHEFSGSAKTSQRVDMGGKADEHVFNIVYELAVRSGDRVERWWIDKPGEVVARVVVPHLHVPRDPVTPDVVAEAGRIRVWRRLRTEGTVDFHSNGTGAVYRSFLDVPEVSRGAAHLYRQANRLPEEWLEDRGNWPAEIKKIFSLTELAAHFPALAGRTGRRVELPDGTDGWHQILQVRVVAANPRHLTAHADGSPFQIWQNTSATAKYKHTGESNHSRGGKANGGVLLELGPLADKTEETEGDSGHPLTGQVYALGGAAVKQKLTTERATSTYPMGITRGTYGGPMHTYRADPLFEITLHRWPGRGVVDRLAGRPRTMSTMTRVMEVKDGLEFVVPQRRIFDLGLPVPDGVPRAEPKVPEGHIDLAMLPGASHPEVLHAEGVLEMMKGWLTERRVLRPGADGTGHWPTPLLSELEASFSSAALLNQFTMLTTSGVLRWLPIPSALGSTRYLWARVTAETLEPMSQLERPEMALMLRGKAFSEQPIGRTRSTEVEVAADLRGRIGSSEHGGLEAAAGYHLASETSRELNDEHVQIYWGQTKSASTELQLRQRFRVEMRITRQQPEVFSAPIRGLRGTALAAGGAIGHRREVESWWQNHDPSDTRFTGDVDGDVRVLVPAQLIIPGPPPPQAHARSLGIDPVWESEKPPPVNQELVDLVFEHGHPWALPAAAGINRWAALAAAPSLSRPSLAKPEFWRPDSTTVDGMQYEVFTHEVLMRLNMPSLLRHRYMVPVGGEKVSVGLRIHGVTPMPEHDVVMLSRHYNQGREVEENLRGGARGWFAGIGVEAGGDVPRGDVLDRLPVGFEAERSHERAAESQEIMERNVAGTQPFRYYRVDVEAVFQSSRHGWLRVRFPDGMYVMLPASLSDDPALRAALVTENETPVIAPVIAPAVDLRSFLTGVKSREEVPAVDGPGPG